jgi:hypothetical protein
MPLFFWRIFMGTRSKVTGTRPENTTPYTAGDVVLGALEFPLIGGYNSHLLITSAALRIDVAAVPAGMTSFRLHFYSITPPSALADNAVWDLPSDDRASYLGYIDLGSPVDVGATLFTQVDAINKQIKIETTSVFGYLVTNGGFTPAGNSEVYVPEIYAVAL